MLNTFTFNGRSSDEFGIRIEKMPVLNRSARKFQADSVRGRNGNIYQLEDAWEEVVQPYAIFAGGKSSNSAVGAFTDIMEWLHSANDYSVLTDTYDPTHYREAVFVDNIDIESMWHTYGRAVINFRCRPQRYIISTPLTPTSGDTITNPTNHIAKPLITFDGGGTTNLLKMEGRTEVSSNNYSVWTVNSNSSLLYKGINTNHRGNGSYVSSVSVTDSTGTLSFITNTNGYGVGFSVSVASDTDYTISADFNGAEATLAVLFYGNLYLGKVEQTADTFNLAFHTPKECRNIVLLFAANSKPSAHIFTNIMLNAGKTAKAFRAYATLSAASVSLNGITARFEAAGFDTIEIDCESENIKIDGADINNITRIVDQYGNMSANYLALEKGANPFEYSITDADAVRIDPRYWEL